MSMMNDLWFEFQVQRVSTKYEFKPVNRNSVKMFETSATVEEILSNKKYFVYLSGEQQAIIITNKGLIQLEQKFEIKEFWISIVGIVFICKPKGKYKVKNINKLRGYLKRKYGECEVEIDDSN